MYNQLSDAQILALLHDPKFVTALLILAVWSLIWKGIALWKAAQNKNMDWFVIMLIMNTVGILEIVYIFYFSKKTKNKLLNP
jgi:methionyl-tRNA synthetase